MQFFTLPPIGVGAVIRLALQIAGRVGGAGAEYRIEGAEAGISRSRNVEPTPFCIDIADHGIYRLAAADKFICGVHTNRAAVFVRPEVIVPAVIAQDRHEVGRGQGSFLLV